MELAEVELDAEDAAKTWQTPAPDTPEQPIEDPPEYSAEELERAAAYQRVNENVAQLEQGRANYELMLGSLIAQQNGIMANEFADLKTPADLDRLARTDPVRLQKLQAFA